jgi:hypothetical protein
VAGQHGFAPASVQCSAQFPHNALDPTDTKVHENWRGGPEVVEQEVGLTGFGFRDPLINQHSGIFFALQMLASLLQVRDHAYLALKCAFNSSCTILSSIG